MPSKPFGPGALPWGALMVLLVSALSLHALVFWIGHSPEPRLLVGDEPMYLQGATKLAAGETWHYESLWPPFQAIFLAVVLKLSGGSLLAVEVIQTLLLVAVAWLLADVIRTIVGSRAVGWIVGVLVLVYPSLAGFAHYFWPEIFHMATLVGAGWILVHRRESWRWVVGGGVLFGLTLCSKYLLWPFLILALPLVVWYVGRRAPKRLLGFTAGALLVLTLVYSSDRMQVKKYPMVESAAFNAWVGLNDTSRKDFVDPIVGGYYHRYVTSPSVPERNEMMWTEIVEMAREAGLARVLARQARRQYFRLLDKDTFFTDQLPGGVIASRGPGYQQTPKPIATLLRAWSYGIYGALLVLAPFGVAVFPRRARNWSRAFLGVLAFAMLIFLVSHVKSRFRLQLMPIAFIYAGCALAWLGTRFGWIPDETDLWDHRPGPAACFMASAAAVTLLVFAFGRTWF